MISRRKMIKVLKMINISIAVHVTILLAILASGAVS